MRIRLFSILEFKNFFVLRDQNIKYSTIGEKKTENIIELRKKTSLQDNIENNSPLDEPAKRNSKDKFSLSKFESSLLSKEDSNCKLKNVPDFE